MRAIKIEKMIKGFIQAIGFVVGKTEKKEDGTREIDKIPIAKLTPVTSDHLSEPAILPFRETH